MASLFTFGRPAVMLVDAADAPLGTVANPVNVTGGGGGGGGDASAANQVITNTEIGALTETAPATDTASSGVNGRLQRIAQRLTTLIGSTIAVSAASLPLPSGAATSAKQDTLAGLFPASIGQKAKTGSLSVEIASDSDLLAKSITTTVGASFTRPADTTPYSIADIVTNSTTAGSVVVITLAVARANDKGFSIPRVRLKKTGTSITNAIFRVRFYKDLPTVTNGDNGAFLSTESTALGSVDVTMDEVYSDFAKGYGVPNVGSAISGMPSSGTQNIFALIEARAAYTPVSAEVFTLVVEVFQD